MYQCSPSCLELLGAEVKSRNGVDRALQIEASHLLRRVRGEEPLLSYRSIGVWAAVAVRKGRTR